MPTPKEQCFKDALDAFNDAFPDQNPNVQMFKDWYREVDANGHSTWSPASGLRSFGHWIGSVVKTSLINAGLADPRPDGAANPVQWRTPDITDGNNKVYDLKFTDAKGNVDPWGNKPGMNNGGTQQTDQRDINRQSDPNGKEMSLDKDSCKCDERGKPQPEVQHVPSPFFLPAPGMAPRGVPGTAPEMVPEPISPPVFGGGFGGLEPVFVP